MSFKSWVTIITLILLAVVVYLSWGKIVEAWGLMGTVNIWIFLLLIPIQFISYYAAGEISFAYLRAKGNLLSTSRWTMARIALELNFVNHILPSGGAAGFSYMSWVLHNHGVSPGRATMAQIVRFILTFIGFICILLVAVIMLTLDHKIDRVIIAISISLVFLVLGGTALTVYIVGNHSRLVAISGWFTKKFNTIVRKLTRGKQQQALKRDIVESFLEDLHRDYLELRREKNILVKPFGWAIMVSLLDALLFFVAFWSLGVIVNPAMIFIAFGISSLVGFISATPGGAGTYEAVMIAFLVSAGVAPDMAIAGTLLARVTLVLGTIIFGYAFYQLTINKYGKVTKPTDI